jgi:2-keto-4-pentenoate hydratase/2-oxohepta-3-ene-1,7-dioic acid hydratase in catechol pathway
MKTCRFQSATGPAWGLVESIGGRDMITRSLAMPEDPSSFGTGQHMTAVALSDAKLLAPVAPSKIVCVGRNYREHVKELGNETPTELVIFFKPPSAVLAPGGTIVKPRVSERVDFEGELGVVIGRTCRNLGADEDVKAYIRGYTCVNDVTARDLQKTDVQWTRAKGFDTFCPVGPVLTDEIDPSAVTLETRVNGEPRQRGNTRDFIFSLDAIIRFVSRVMTLAPGDLISTGTPAGVGPLNAGDVVEVTIPGIGTLRNPVADE